MLLYHYPGACSLAPHILLRETGAPFSLEKVDLRNGEQQSDTYLSINPKGRVPVLRDGDEVLTELPAISMYICRKRPELALWPESPLAEARCLEWFNWLSGTLHGTGYGALWRPQRFTDAATDFPRVQAAGRRTIDACHALIEQRLDGRWALGADYSAVDPFLLVFYLWGRKIGADMHRFERWSRHARSMLARRAVQDALSAEGLQVEAA